MPAVPSGTVTFLFSDIEGSTTRWEQHPAKMRAALARHDALLHEGITAHGGVVVTERGEGDSFFALFPRPTAALAAACTIQRALSTEPWPQELAPIRVRMALHTGEAGLWEGHDYRGAAVNRCARLRAVAHGGQVLLSGATYELVRDQLPPGVTLRDLGEHRLKDLTRPEHIFQAVIPGLSADFPPLKTLDTPRHNLPVQLTPFIGREREVAAVRERLLEPQTHLLTLTGPGGTGKTRLALQVATEVLEDFPDGVFFANLAPISDPALVLPTIAQVLGVVEQAAEPLLETLKGRLRGTRTLLLLDNFEQVVEAAPQLNVLLGSEVGLKALVTSRVVLRVQGEREYPVPPLAVPDLHHLPPPDALSQYEAVRLFIARAQDVQPDFTVTTETAPAVAAICTRLDGLPLAIELAAARIRVLPPQAMLTRLGHRLTLAAGGARDLPARQQTLRSTIDWSYHLLTADEQTLFARLGVFVGGCTLEAIEAVCNPEGTVDVLEGVESLLSKSLVRRVEGVAGEPRMVMLETLHEYAWERLEERGEAGELRRWHASYFLVLAEMGDQALLGREQVAWLHRLEADHDNLRAALDWAQASRELELGLRLAGALWYFRWMQGYFSEGRRTVEGLLERAGRTTEAIPRVVRAKALVAAALIARSQGDLAQATAWGEESLELAGVTGAKEMCAIALCTLGLVALSRVDYNRATALFAESLALWRELGGQWGCANLLSNLARVALRQGDYSRALALSQEGLTVNRAVGDKWAQSGLLGTLAEVARAQGDTRQATALLEESLALSQDLGLNRTVPVPLIGLGAVALTQGAYTRAATLYREVLALVHTMGDREYVSDCLEGLAGAAWGLGYPQRAARLFGAAAATRAAAGTSLAPSGRAAYDRHMAAVRAALGEEPFFRAWAEGQAMTLEHAIAYAVETPWQG